MGAVISIRAEVGDGTIVAEGAVVKMEKAIPGGVVVAGNPAKVMRDVSQKDRELWDWAKQLYIDLAKKYLTIGMQRID
jgi:carbonic anhydrase/acetyltransferase-like protein (isoleucine patch superfamily)